MARRVFLVGYMGSGKSTFGRRLATLLNWEFLDLDTEIERRAGMSVSEIFDKYGEGWFRALEGKVIEDAARTSEDTVVAMGGGAVCTDGVMEMLSTVGITVYLKMPPGRLAGRMSGGGRSKRPKIAGMDDEKLLAYIEKTLPEREKYYNKATFALDCEAVSDDTVVRILLQAVEPTPPAK